MRMLATLAARFARLLRIVCKIPGAALLPLARIGVRILVTLLRMLRVLLRMLGIRSFLAFFAGALGIVGEITRPAPLRTARLFRLVRFFVHVTRLFTSHLHYPFDVGETDSTLGPPPKVCGRSAACSRVRSACRTRHVSP